ncbi:MAG TPA: CHAT domain-containing protein [Terriglobia bacterium]|nr:CHAT domain-containing protein [Terriglobia bacterium]
MTLLDPEEYLAGLAQIRDAAQQRAYISSSNVVPSLGHVEALSQKIREIGWKDLSLAEALAESNRYLASQINTPAAWGYATRSTAQVLHMMRKCVEAQPLFEQAVKLFSEAGLMPEAGRTTVTVMENLMYLGRYEEALRLAGPARAALEKVGDTRYLALIEVSLGNLYYRLRRYGESLEHYSLADEGCTDPDIVAAIGLGRAHVLTGMNRFDEALEAYETTRQHCEQHGLSLWVDIVDRGMSTVYLHRGNLTASLHILDQLRHKHEAANDPRRVALCDIDRAHIYSQLNLFEDASAVAGRAFETFQKLGNRFESALSLTTQGVAEFKLAHNTEAQAAFQRARDLFVQEGNEISVAAADLCLAQLLMHEQQFAQAGKLARRSAEIFEKHQVPVRAANARVWSALSLQQTDGLPAAVAEAERALNELDGLHAPWVFFQALNTLGKLKEMEEGTSEAESLYMRAITELELLRGNIKLDEFRMSFGKDKYQVYQNMVGVKLRTGDLRTAFEFVERSKSRTLIDQMERSVDTAWDAGAAESPRFKRLQKVREELNILYSRLNELGTTARSATADTVTKDEIDRREQEFVELLRAAGTEKPGWATLQSMPAPSVDDIQKMLEPDERLIEYYAVGESFQVFVIGRESFHVLTDIAHSVDVRTAIRGLNFQLSKFHLQPAYLNKHAAALLAATQHHLKTLHDQLIAPISHVLKASKRLIIVPHHLLHYIPFHALYDGEHYLVDNFGVSYAASASVLRICRSRKTSGAGRELILAVADSLTPHINDEVDALKRLFPNADVFTGAGAGEEQLRKYGPTAGKIHIAAHGVFRADNPDFSSIRFGDKWLNLFDIFNLELGAEITTLSACETGMSDVLGGDELLGLARGFLRAGTPSLVVSLWMVNDKSTAQLMCRFYEALRDGTGKANALRQAMVEVKAAFPHPYYWAPFILLGKS